MEDNNSVQEQLQAPPQYQAAPQYQQPQQTGAPQQDEPLGPGGYQALQREREARKALEKQLQALTNTYQEYQKQWEGLDPNEARQIQQTLTEKYNAELQQREEALRQLYEQHQTLQSQLEQQQQMEFAQQAIGYAQEQLFDTFSQLPSMPIDQRAAQVIEQMIMPAMQINPEDGSITDAQGVPLTDYLMQVYQEMPYLFQSPGGVSGAGARPTPPMRGPGGIGVVSRNQPGAFRSNLEAIAAGQVITTD